ncbi:nuclease-related domain-containing protein [Ureibacillus aquaedulcis]|uniref:Nuclease-related domain-containing protein n=1 Tax=Ureibacillus aquaedulcis TaxID=3058421 RepID=A0ABT8GUV1_9BACL|nr:nuclease-related domain-containing protein [Ureibacillus sp. BA0131]MDN4495190.1 nuclease-related domain-containing protein [Ureibacillus sp. BA0131]
MAILVLFFIILIGIVFAINVYVYENSDFSKTTGHPFISVWTNGKVRFLYKLSQKLNKVNGEYKLLSNIALPESERKVDYLLLHQSGIYIINAKDPGGWIYGNEQDIQWAQVLENGQMSTFPNPVLDNKLKINGVKKYIPEVDKDLFQSLIIFGNHCSFKKIEVHSLDVEVMKIHELESYWKNRMDQVLTKDQIMAIYSKLKPYVIPKQSKENGLLKDVASS